MKMNKREKLSFSLALIINLVGILLIPGYKLEDVLDKKLKVGLVSFEKKKVSQKVTNKEKSFQKEKKVEQKEIVEKKQNEVKKKLDKAKKKNLALSSISKSMKSKDFVGMNAINRRERAIQDDTLSSIMKAEKKEVKFERENKIGFDNKNLEFDDTIKRDDIIKDNDENLFIDVNEKGLTESIKIDDIKVEGLPSGYKLGVLDGDIIARWDKGNREPSYPSSAELKGLQGTVRVKIDLDEKGNVTNFIMEKGSGVPEINNAIESIGRTWKIYLSKHGLSIKGRVVLDYTFKLEGGI